MDTPIPIYDRLDSLSPELRGAVIAIGNFDGVHRGHQALLAAAREAADARHIRLGVLTFAPHPRRLFRPDDPPFGLTPVPLKAARLAVAGVDFVVALPFDWPFASQRADDFIRHILQENLSPAHIVVGEDFRFGQLRAGDAELIEAAGIPVTTIPPLMAEADRPVSASLIRQALQKGEIGKANELLGWPWEMRGIVVSGDRRGRDLGYPTANVALGETLHPAYGVYASLVRLEGEDVWRQAATNIGIRPMFELREGRMETFILDFDRDIYGLEMQVRPVRRLRGEAKFDSLDALIAQMAKDCDAARAVLADMA